PGNHVPLPLRSWISIRAVTVCRQLDCGQPRWTSDRRVGERAMNGTFSGYQRILAASDFSQHSVSALKRAVWIAQQSCQQLVAAHVVADLRRAIHHTSYRSRLEFLEDKEEHFQRELRKDADEKLKRQIADLGSTGIQIKYETLLGEPYEELIHSVQQEGYDLVVAGTRGHGALRRLVLGSTAT